MTKSSTKLIAGLATLAVIFGGYYGLKVYNARQEEKEAEEEAYRDTAAEVAEDEVTSLSFQIDGEKTTFLHEDDAWKLEGDDTFPVNAEKMTEILSYLEPLQVEQTLEDAAEISEYGLDEPANELEVKEKDGTTVTVAIGDNNSTTGNDYMMLNGETGTVYTILTDLSNALSEDLYDYASGEELPSMMAEYIVGVDVERESGDYSLRKEDDTWSLKDSDKALDQDTIDSAISGLGYLSFTNFVAHNCEDASEYGIDEDSPRITIHYDETAKYEYEGSETESEEEIVKETVVLLVGDTDENGDYYVQQEGSKEVHTISATALQTFLDGDLSAWEAEETETTTEETETDATELEETDTEKSSAAEKKESISDTENAIENEEDTTITDVEE